MVDLHANGASIVQGLGTKSVNLHCVDLRQPSGSGVACSRVKNALSELLNERAPKPLDNNCIWNLCQRYGIDHETTDLIMGGALDLAQAESVINDAMNADNAFERELLDGSRRVWPIGEATEQDARTITRRLADMGRLDIGVVEMDQGGDRAPAYGFVALSDVAADEELARIAMAYIYAAHDLPPAALSQEITAGPSQAETVKSVMKACKRPDGLVVAMACQRACEIVSEGLAQTGDYLGGMTRAINNNDQNLPTEKTSRCLAF